MGCPTHCIMFIKINISQDFQIGILVLSISENFRHFSMTVDVLKKNTKKADVYIIYDKESFRINHKLIVKFILQVICMYLCKGKHSL